MVLCPAPLGVTENPRTRNAAGDLNNGRGAAKRNPVILSGISFVAVSSALSMRAPEQKRRAAGKLPRIFCP